MKKPTENLKSPAKHAIGTTKVLIDALVFEQKGQKMYLGIATPDFVSKAFYVAPNSRTNPDGVQRLLKKPKVEAICKYVQHQHGVMPTTGVLNIERKIKIHTILKILDEQF